MPDSQRLSQSVSPRPYFADGQTTLYHGDCLEVMSHIGAVDLVLTDLPYGLTDCVWDSALPLDALWGHWKRMLSPTGAVVLTASQPFMSALVMSNPKAFKHEWIWEKNAGSNFGTVKRQPMKEHESVLVFAWGRYHYEPIMQERSGGGLARVRSGVVNYATKAEAYQDGGLLGTASSKRPDLRYPRSIQRFNRDRGLHPTQKPVGLMEYLIRTYTPDGATVLDCCAGSGSTLVAARNLGRKAIGIETEERYCDVIARRMNLICDDCLDALHNGIEPGETSRGELAEVVEGTPFEGYFDEENLLPMHLDPLYTQAYGADTCRRGSPAEIRHQREGEAQE